MTRQKISRQSNFNQVLQPRKMQTLEQNYTLVGYYGKMLFILQCKDTCKFIYVFTVERIKRIPTGIIYKKIYCLKI